MKTNIWRKELSWLPIEARPEFKILCYTYKAIHDYMVIYRIIRFSVYNHKRCAHGLRSGTLVSRDYAQLRQILPNMDICFIVLSYLFYGTRYQRASGQLSHLMHLKSQ